MNGLKTTNTLLMVIVITLVFYILKTLSFIFIPLILSMFLALLFLPLMRWFKKKRVPKPVSVFMVVLIIVGTLKLGGELIKLTSNEILSANNLLFEKAETKLISIIAFLESFFGVERLQGENVLNHYFGKNYLLQNFGSTLGFIRSTLSATLLTAFFTILLLSESINFQELLNKTLFRRKFSSIKTFIRIENDIIKFVKVKFIISLLTGLGFGITCFFFDISFPVFWGLFAFLINFIQLIGSVVSILLLALFAFIEIEPTGVFLIFILILVAIQILMGGVLEPIFMGKTFSVNVITILIMLLLWGYIWQIPGLILAIPITVFIKIILEQFPKTKVIASLMSGPDRSVNIHRKKIEASF